jgi:hypothetical protein
MRRILLFAIVLPLLAESVAGLKWTAPSNWKNQGQRPMRAATYTIPLAAGDTTEAECAVYFFGEGQGGSIQANLDRWKGQVVAASGKPADAQIQHKTIHGLAVTTIDSTGVYTGMGGPTAAEKTASHGYRLIGAIVEGPGGNVFIKCTGPTKTIAANQAAFDQLVNSFDKEK